MEAVLNTDNRCSPESANLTCHNTIINKEQLPIDDITARLDSNRHR